MEKLATFLTLLQKPRLIPPPPPPPLHRQDQHEDVQSIDSCEYIWEAGVGFSSAVTHSAAHDSHRTEILKLLLTCFSHTMYLPPTGERGICFWGNCRVLL